MKKKLNIFAALAAATALSSSPALAQEMEKCKVVDANGKGLIRAHKADCAGSSHSCAGQNVAGDAEAWVMVPAGECDKLNKGDFSGVSEDIKAKIEVGAFATSPATPDPEDSATAPKAEPEDVTAESDPEDATSSAHQHTHAH